MDCDELLTVRDPSEGDLREVATRYRDARYWANELNRIADDLEMELSARMEADEVPVSGVGLLVRRTERRSTWKDEHASADFRRHVGQAVIHKIALDVATGELDPVKRNVATVTVDLMFDVVPAFSSVKAPGRKLGIEVEEYRVISEVYRVSLEEVLEP
jgi:hypothetical protein